MGSQHKIIRILFLALLTTFVIAGISQAMAQDPPPSAPPSSVDPASTAPKDPPAVIKTDNTVGKTKLEQQTGTKNDRIFEVLPNYGTVRSNKSLPPLTVGQKFRIATASTFD